MSVRWHPSPLGVAATWLALTASCAARRAGPEGAYSAEGFTPIVGAVYVDDEGAARPLGNACYPNSRPFGFRYESSGIACLLDPAGRVLELETVDDTPGALRYRRVASVELDSIRLPKRRALLKSLRAAGLPASAEFERHVAEMTRTVIEAPPLPPLRAFVANSDYPLASIGHVFERKRDGATIAGVAYLVNSRRQLIEFRFAEFLPDEGICNSAVRYVEAGPVDPASIQPPERAAILEPLLSASAPSVEEYALIAGHLTDGAQTFKVSAP